MARGFMIATTRAVDVEREDEFNRWYDDFHLPEVMASGAFVRAARFRATTRLGPGGLEATGEPATYVTPYEIASDGPIGDVAAGFLEHLRKGTTGTDSIDRAASSGIVYELVGDWKTA